MNSYFATIEQQLDRMLRGKPIAVVANMSDSTSAIAVSYEAKKLGISTVIKIYSGILVGFAVLLITNIHPAYHVTALPNIPNYLTLYLIFMHLNMKLLNGLEI